MNHTKEPDTNGIEKREQGDESDHVGDDRCDRSNHVHGARRDGIEYVREFPVDVKN